MDLMQLVEKVEMNSKYGLQIVKYRIGLLPCTLLGRLVTRMGRGRVHLAEREVEKAPWFGQVMYGDTDSIMPRCTRIFRSHFPDHASYEKRVVQCLYM